MRIDIFAQYSSTSSTEKNPDCFLALCEESAGRFYIWKSAWSCWRTLWRILLPWVWQARCCYWEHTPQLNVGVKIITACFCMHRRIGSLMLPAARVYEMSQRASVQLPARLSFVWENTSWAATGGKCPTAPKTFLNEHSCKLLPGCLALGQQGPATGAYLGHQDCQDTPHKRSNFWKEKCGIHHDTSHIGRISSNITIACFLVLSPFRLRCFTYLLFVWFLCFVAFFCFSVLLLLGAFSHCFLVSLPCSASLCLWHFRLLFLSASRFLFRHASSTTKCLLPMLRHQRVFRVASRLKPPAPSVMDSGSLRSSSCFRLVFPALGLYGACIKLILSLAYTYFDPES